TVRRAFRHLQSHGCVVATRGVTKLSSCRYSPKFQSVDWVSAGASKGHSCAADWAADVHQSYLNIQLQSALRTAKKASEGTPEFNRNMRGAVELTIARKLGANGFDVLARLSSIDDAITERLCWAFEAGLVGDRELTAARLAARQAR